MEQSPTLLRRDSGRTGEGALCGSEVDVMTVLTPPPPPPRIPLREMAEESERERAREREIERVARKGGEKLLRAENAL